MNRQPRDERGPDDARDKRDERKPGDPRDARDPRLPDDPFDAATAAGAAAEKRAAAGELGVPRFVKWIIFIAVVGLAGVAFAAWQSSSLREDYERRLCEQAVAERNDDRAVWLYLVARDPERVDDPDVVAFVEFLDGRLPPVMCVGNIPTKIDQPEE